MCATVGMGCVLTRVSITQSRKVHLVHGSFLFLFRQEFCRHQLDPQQLAAQLRDCAWTNSAAQTQHMTLDTLAILKLVYISV